MQFNPIFSPITALQYPTNTMSQHSPIKPNSKPANNAALKLALYSNKTTKPNSFTSFQTQTKANFMNNEWHYRINQRSPAYKLAAHSHIQ